MFSESFIVLALTFRSLIHRVSFCMWYEVGVQLYIFAYGYPVVPAPFVEETILSPLNCPSTLVENQLTINVRVKKYILNGNLKNEKFG